MFCQKVEIDHVLKHNKGERDHLVSRFLLTLNELQGRVSNCSSLSELTYFFAKKLPSFVF